MDICQKTKRKNFLNSTEVKNFKGSFAIFNKSIEQLKEISNEFTADLTRNSKINSKCKLTESKKNQIESSNDHNCLVSKPDFELRSPLSKKSKMSNTIGDQEPFEDSSNCEHDKNFPTIDNLKLDEQSVETSFEELKISYEIIKGLHSLQIHKPNDVQREILTNLIDNTENDFYIRTLPNRGKKTAILINLLQRINPDINYPQCFWVAPTTETAFQMGEFSNQLTHHSKMSSKTFLKTEVMNGSNEHLVISTLGTLLYMLKMNILDNSKVKCLFIDQIDLCFFSETYKAKIIKLMKSFKQKFQLIVCSSTTEDQPFEFFKRFSSSRYSIILLNLLSIDQYFTNLIQFRVTYHNNEDRWNAFLKVMRNCIFNRILVFATGIKSVNVIYRKLLSNQEFGDRVLMLTGDLIPDERIERLEKFKQSKNHIIILTTPLLQGTNFGDEPCMVINYDLYMFENNLNEYLNRLSFCLKFERPGFVVNFDDVKQRYQSKMIEDHFKTKFIDLDVSDGNDL